MPRQPLPPVPSPFIYIAEKTGSSVRGEAGNKTQSRFLLFPGTQKRGAGGHTEKEAELRVPDRRGAATLPPLPHRGSSRSAQGAPGAGRFSPWPWPGSARCKRRQPSVLRRKPPPPSGRVSAAAAGAEGLPQPGNSQTRPHAAGDRCSEPPRRTLLLGRAEMCAAATAGTQAEGVKGA